MVAVARRALVYYVTMLGLLSATGCVYLYHPFYQRADNAAILTWFTAFYRLFLAFGGAYYLVEGAVFLRWLKRPRLPLTTTPAVVLLLVRRVAANLSPSGRKRPVLQLLAAPRIRTRLLGFVIKAYFGPLMIAFGHHHWAQFTAAWQQFALSHADTNAGYQLVYHSLFLVDVTLAVIGYFGESTLLRNRLRSADPVALSWLVTLACYPPFNGASDTLLPLRMTADRELAYPTAVLVTLKGATLVCYSVYVWATVALNVRFSNLTHRGIVRWGPYRMLRHPAYTAKNLAWWLEYLPYMRRGANVLPLLGWNALYCLRGLYEEKHLSADPAYREYQRRVRWRFLPGLW